VFSCDILNIPSQGQVYVNCWKYFIEIELYCWSCIYNFKSEGGYYGFFGCSLRNHALPRPWI